MAKTKRNVGREILDGLREIKRGEYGRVINVPNVATVREKTGLSQSRFATLLGVSVRTLQDWEQGRRAPSGAARTLLLVAAKHPKALLEVAWARAFAVRQLPADRRLGLRLDLRWLCTTSHRPLLRVATAQQ